MAHAAALREHLTVTSCAALLLLLSSAADAAEPQAPPRGTPAAIVDGVDGVDGVDIVDVAALARVLGAVDGDRVDYARVEARAADLRTFLDAVARLDPATLARAPRPARLALLVNAYNAAVLADVVALGLARKHGRVIDEKGFFDGRTHTIAGRALTKNALEGEVRALGDPRVHFVLNCASRDCPPLAAQPFRAATVDAALEERTRAALASPRAAAMEGGALVVVELFSWYRDDFGGDAGVRAFVRRYRPDLKILDDTPIRPRPYDWTLNAK